MLFEGISNSQIETKNLGKKLSQLIPVGSTILVYGDLGAGKTVISSGLVESFTKIKYSVTSPTFTIVQEYDGETKVNHFDLYRLYSLSELENIGVYEYLFDASSINIIEWPERAPELENLLNSVFRLDIVKLSNNSRKITLKKIKG